MRRYADQLRDAGVPRRSLAAVGLGDTAAPAAFDVLLIALQDRSKQVRTAAVTAVRRLAVAGLEEQYAGHELPADVDRVRREAARTLVLLGDRAVVADARTRASWWQSGWKRELDECLRGEMPPLKPMWIGERGYSPV